METETKCPSPTGLGNGNAPAVFHHRSPARWLGLLKGRIEMLNGIIIFVGALVYFLLPILFVVFLYKHNEIIEWAKRFLGIEINRFERDCKIIYSILEDLEDEQPR